MLNIPNKFLYTKEHEWADFSGKDVTIGITEFAQSQLGDIVILEFPEIGDEITQVRSFGEIEAVKTVADFYAPVTGEIIEFNSELENNAEIINSDPLDKGWLVKIKLSDSDEINGLLSYNDYQKLVK